MLDASRPAPDYAQSGGPPLAAGAGDPSSPLVDAYQCAAESIKSGKRDSDKVSDVMHAYPPQILGDASVWKSGEPICFEELVPTVEPVSRLTPRHLKVFDDCDPNGAYGWIDPERRINEIVLLWGKGCLASDSLLTDSATGETRTARDWERSGLPLTVPTWDGERVFAAQASPVYRKGRAPPAPSGTASGSTSSA